MMLGDRIKLLRNKKGIYQQELADKLNVSKSTVAMWEINKREPNYETLVAIAEFFECSLDYLMGKNMNFELLPHEIDEGVICCPICNSDCIHFVKYVGADFDNEKSYGAALEFWCEEEHNFFLLIESYKGNTYFVMTDENGSLYHESIDFPYEPMPISLKKIWNEDNEHEIIKKYRALDERGKKVVDLVLNEEYEFSYPPIKYLTRPYYSISVSAGLGNPLDEAPIEEKEIEDTPEHRRGDFIVKINGDSMEPQFSNGDMVLVQKQPNVEIGEVGIFVLNGESYIKKLGKNELISINPNYSPKPYTPNDSIICCGKVLEKVICRN